MVRVVDARSVTVRMPSAAAIRRTSRPDDADGLIRLLFIREHGRVGLVQTARETAETVDQFLARYLADMITDVAAPAVVVTVSRPDGRATSHDRQLWRLLAERLTGPTALLDVVAIGPSRAWSVRRSRVLSPTRRRRAARRSASPAAAR